MWSDVPNLRHLRAFATVVETGGVTRAAQAIHLSQPAITDRKSTRLNSSHIPLSRMPSSA